MKIKHLLMTLALAAATLTATGQTVMTNAGGTYTAVQLQTGTLQDATSLTIKGRWNYNEVIKLRQAITGDNVYEGGSNAVLTTVTFAADAVVGKIDYLFQNCTALTGVTMPEAENATTANFQNAFNGCTALKTVDLSKFPGIANMQAAFQNCTALESVTLPANGVDVSLFSAFAYCKALKSIDLSGFAKVSDLTNTFNGCTVLESVALPTGENTAAVSLSSAFASCKALKTVDLSKFAKVSDMTDTFKGCTVLESVALPTGENTAAVSFKSAFNGCTALKTVDLSKFPGIANMQAAFNGCTVLESVALPTGENTATVNFSFAFSFCTTLKSIDLSNFTNISDLLWTFIGCTALEEVVMPTKENTNAVGFGNTFYDCRALKGTIDLTNFTNVLNLLGTFENCASLTAVKLGGERLVSDSQRIFERINRNCLVYVPASWGPKPSMGWDVIYIAGDIAERDVTLWEDKPFHCPEAFTVAPGKRIIHYYDFGSEQSGIGGKAAGWGAISLPFTPGGITGRNAAGNWVTLVPFNAEGTYEGKGTDGVVPFWLRALTPDSYTPVTTIEPDKPYIIAMPNNPAYDAKYNVTGSVTFSAYSTADAPITIGVTPDVLPSATGSQYTLHSNYSTIPSAADVYVINTEGTAFVANGGDARPFRPYVTANNPMGAPAQFVIGEDEGGATAIEEAVLMGHSGGNGANGLRVYGSDERGALVVEAVTASTVDVVAIDGRTVRTVSLHEGVNTVNGLAAGVYVVGGQKAVVR